MDEEKQAEPFESRLIAISLIDLPKGQRKTKAADVDQLAQSIETQGRLQPIGVLPADVAGRHELLFGGRRLAALKKLKRDVIEAKVFDLDPAHVEAVMYAENLFRRDIDKKQRFDALALWVAHYKLKHPDSFGAAAPVKGNKKTMSARIADARPVTGLAIPEGTTEAEAAPQEVAVEPEALTPAKALSALTGQGKTQSKHAIRIAEKFTKEQRDALIDRNIGTEAMNKVAAIKDEEKRATAVTLIASGLEPLTAIAAATAPPNSTIEGVANPDADGYKAEADMTDEEGLGRLLRRGPREAQVPGDLPDRRDPLEAFARPEARVQVQDEAAPRPEQGRHQGAVPLPEHPSHQRLSPEGLELLRAVRRVRRGRQY